jgi:hypothetical protein
MPRNPTDGNRLVELQFCDGAPPSPTYAPPTLGCRTRLPASSLFARENRHSEISLIWRELGDGFARLTVASRHAPLLLELIHSPVPPHRRECAVHSSQEPRLILPESDPEWLRVVGNLRHDAQIGSFRRQPRRQWSDLHHGCDAPRSKIRHRLLDPVERVDLYAANLASLLRQFRPLKSGCLRAESRYGFRTEDMARSFGSRSLSHVRCC